MRSLRVSLGLFLYLAIILFGCDRNLIFKYQLCYTLSNRYHEPCSGASCRKAMSAVYYFNREAGGLSFASDTFIRARLAEHFSKLRTRTCWTDEFGIDFCGSEKFHEFCCPQLRLSLGSSLRLQRRGPYSVSSSISG